MYTPKWFYGKDIAIDIFSILVLFLIAFFSIKFYRINKKNKNHLYLSLSYILLGLSFVFKILTNFTIYYVALETRNIGFVQFTYNALKSTDTLFFTGFLLYRLFTLVGLVILYSIYYKSKSKSNFLLLLYLVSILVYFSQSAYYIFHLTSLILLSLITLYYFRTYKKSKNTNTQLVSISFFIITISQIIFILIKYNPFYYVLAESLQLIGYVLLLITFTKVLKFGK